jgi:hypothetical protein
MVTATLPGMAVRAVDVAAVGPVAMSQVMSATTTARKGIGHVSAGRTNGMRRCMPHKQRRRMNQLCSSQA